MAEAALQRKNMVESQVRPSDVTDRRIARAMLDLPREQFVPKHAKSLAYRDTQIGLDTGGSGQPRALLDPRTLAKLIQLCDIQPTDVVLDAGCGTGYSAAVLARLAQTVVGLECDPVLAQEATRILQSLAIDNVVIIQGDLPSGYPSEGPYDAILIDGAVGTVPDALLGQLKDGGRLVAVVSEGHLGRAAVWLRTGALLSQTTAFDASAPILPGFDRAKAFLF